MMPTLDLIAKRKFPKKPGLQGAFIAGFRVEVYPYKLQPYRDAAVLGAILRAAVDPVWADQSAWLNGQFYRPSEEDLRAERSWVERWTSTPVPTQPPFDDFRVSIDTTEETYERRVQAVKASVTEAERERDRLARAAFEAKFPGLIRH